MKNLIISIICLLLLMIPWGIYQEYSRTTIDHYTDIILTRTIPAAESGEWQQAEESFDYIARDWDRFRRISAYFTDTYSLNDITSHISRVSCYIRQQDAVNTIAETTGLHHELLWLRENEEPSAGNLF